MLQDSIYKQQFGRILVHIPPQKNLFLIQKWQLTLSNICYTYYLKYHALVK